MYSWLPGRLRRFDGDPLRALYSELRDPLMRSDTLVLTSLAVVIGCVTGVGATGFHLLLGSADDLWNFALRGLGLANGGWLIVVFPVVGTLIAIGMIHALARNDTSHGTSAVIESVALRGGRLPARALLTKVAAAAIFIGSGGSAGPEDPSVQLGGVSGSIAARWARLSPRRTRTLVACGVAGAVAAAFNAPIAGVFFALEVVVGEMSSTLFAPVVIAAVSSSAIGRWLNGDHPALRVPAYELGSAIVELPLYVVLGVLAAIVGVLFIRLLFAFEDRLARIRMGRVPRAVSLGLIIGTIGLWLPEVVGVGYGTVGSVLTGGTSGASTLALLLAVKLVLTALCIAALGIGGTFAPSLYLGAMLGGIVGIAAHALTPSALPAAYALVGMGGVLTAVIRAPITSVLLIFEITNDYRIILPIMLCVAVANIVAGKLHPESIYTERLARHGIRLGPGRNSGLMELITVREAMTTNVVVVQWHQPLREVLATMTERDLHATPVADGPSLVGIVTAGDIMRVLEEGIEPDCPVGEIAITDLVVAYPDQSLHDALMLFAVREVRQVPVVEPRTSSVVGMLRRSDIILSYSSAVGEKAGRGAVQPGEGTRAKHHHITIRPGMPADGRSLEDLKLPDGVILVAVDRHGWTLKPDAGTLLKAGDVLTILSPPELLQATLRLLGGRRGTDSPGRTT